jgi:pimeloyl-ACP methyl ester carboxylesterase
MNHKANAEYHQRPNNSDHLAMPALFLAGHFDYTCESITSRLTEPMRQKCKNLTEATIDSGHWMAQEKPQAVNRELARWIFNQNLVGQES